MSIPEIVEKHGWTTFRDMESDVARDLAKSDNLIIDTGGGVIERPENVDVLRENSRMIWLKASVSSIVARIQGDTERPSLTGAKSFTDEVAEVLERRTVITSYSIHYTKLYEVIVTHSNGASLRVFRKEK